MHESEFDPESVPAIDVRRIDRQNGVVLEVAGEIDLSNARQLGAVFEHVLLDQPAVLVIDLSQVTFLGSAGLSLLVGARDRAGDGEVRVAAPSATARRAIEIMALDQVLPVFSTVDDALKANSAQP
ncbi:MAG TPA: STAS domain-containing protein [Actinophytocola sp.]|jgi:anti-anti-sigma factor|nr:STAS domain-containing protein [Actinophytocola sp.]